MDSVTALFVPILRASWYAFALAACVALGLPTTTWRAETPENVLVDMAARMLEILSIVAIEAYRGMFLRHARGDWLTFLARETYETTRLEATFAACIGQLVNTSGNTYNIPSGDTLAVQKTGVDDFVYAIDGPLTIAPGTLAGLVIRCTRAGSGGNAAVGQINLIVGQSLPNVTVSNTSEATARDRELDTDLRSRALLATGPTSPAGPAAAYKYIARGGDLGGAVDAAVAAVGITRVSNVVDVATGSVTVYYGTPTAGISGTDTTGSLGLINNKVRLLAVSLGVDYIGLSGTPVTLDVVWEAYIRADSNISSDDLAAQINSEISDFLMQVDIGGYFEPTDPPGTLGSVSLNKVRGFVTDVTFGGIKPVTGGAVVVNGSSLVDFDLEAYEFPVPGSISGVVWRL